jgi:nucleoside-diphosphate-sugar epimerase
MNILASAQKFPGIKRIVITSSLAVIGPSSPEDKTTVFNGKLVSHVAPGLGY